MTRSPLPTGVPERHRSPALGHLVAVRVGQACIRGTAVRPAHMHFTDELTLDGTLLRAFCRLYGIRSLRSFGSAARNELRGGARSRRCAA